jgi:hypothetical protein
MRNIDTDIGMEKDMDTDMDTGTDMDMDMDTDIERHSTKDNQPLWSFYLCATCKIEEKILLKSFVQEDGLASL